MTSTEKNDKWKYIFKNSSRDFILMAMISISMISILVVSNIGNENTQYMIKQQAQDKIKDDQDQKEAEQARTVILGILSDLNNDVHDINMTLSQTKILLDRLLLFEDQIHNENLIKFKKLDKVIAGLSNGLNWSKTTHNSVMDKLNLIGNQTK